jgi:hypothetical protein
LSSTDELGLISAEFPPSNLRPAMEVAASSAEKEGMRSGFNEGLERLLPELDRLDGDGLASLMILGPGRERVQRDAWGCWHRSLP